MGDWKFTKGINLEYWWAFYIKRLPISQEEVDLCVTRGWPLTELWIFKFGPFEFELTRVLHTNTQSMKENQNAS